MLGWSAVRLARAIRERACSSVDAVEACLQQIDAVDPTLNAVVQRDDDGALAHAAAADASQAAGSSLGPLHGVPFTAKDNFETRALVTAIGVRERSATTPSSDATAVARMRAAGAILVAKTNCPPWGGGLETDNELYGRTNNPYDAQRTPGGSSGGEAALIAAGGSPCGLGSDSGGSIRLPAHFCGIASIKPTSGLVPTTGVLDDEGPIGAMSDPRTQVGLLSRHVEDLAALLRVVAGPDGRDGGVPPVTMRDMSDVDHSGLRVILETDNGTDMPTTQTVDGAVRAARALAEAGARVEEVTIPSGGHALTEEVWESYRGRMDTSQLYRLLRRWDLYRREMLEFMDSFDLIVSPVHQVPAPRHGHMWDQRVSYTTPYSLTGWPSVVVRVATSPEAMPIGVQLVAAPWRDDVALASASLIERVTGGWEPPPMAEL